jgi:DNA-directed RNA polymerase subunit F
MNQALELATKSVLEDTDLNKKMMTSEETCLPQTSEELTSIIQTSEETCLPQTSEELTSIIQISEETCLTQTSEELTSLQTSEDTKMMTSSEHKKMVSSKRPKKAPEYWVALIISLSKDLPGDCIIILITELKKILFRKSEKIEELKKILFRKSEKIEEFIDLPEYCVRIIVSELRKNEKISSFEISYINKQDYIISNAGNLV